MRNLIDELNKTDFYKCKRMINENGQIEARAIVDGINPGRIFVDNLETPSTGLIWLGNNDGFIFIGNENNKEFNDRINHHINHVIVPEANKVGLGWFEAIGNHVGWNLTLSKVFEHRQLSSWNQKVYTISKEDYLGNIKPIDQGYTPHKIDKSLLDPNTFIKNIDFLLSRILEFWSSLVNFLDKGKGYCIVKNENIVSFCLSGFVVDHIHCIDIETLKEHQGKKLAQHVAHYFVRDCIENNEVPYWDCMEENKPSIAVAENIGFRNTFNYKGFYFKL